MPTMTAQLARMARAAVGLSLRDAAQQIGIGINTLQRYENEEGTEATGNKIAQYYNDYHHLSFLREDHRSDDGGGPGIRLPMNRYDAELEHYWLERLDIFFFEASAVYQKQFDTNLTQLEGAVEILAKDITASIAADLHTCISNRTRTKEALVKSLRVRIAQMEGHEYSELRIDCLGFKYVAEFLDNVSIEETFADYLHGSFSGLKPTAGQE